MDLREVLAQFIAASEEGVPELLLSNVSHCDVLVGTGECC